LAAGTTTPHGSDGTKDVTAMCAEVLENSSVNGGFSWWIFQQVIFDYQRVAEIMSGAVVVLTS